MNTFIIIAVILAIVSALSYRFRYFIVNVIWNLFVKCISDEHLEYIVRDQYETFKHDRKSFSLEGIQWLKDMVERICCIKAGKLYSANMLETQKNYNTLCFWQDVSKNLSYEINRREYFRS